MFKIHSKIILIVALLICQNSLGHGEDKLGPNGGFIKMPGAFHTEVVPDGDSQIKIYLLDINWKNPSVKDSSLEASISIAKKDTKLSCEKKSEFYHCQIPKGSNLKKGKLKITAQREGQKGNEAIYKLPLKLEKLKVEHSDHSGHH